MKKSIEQQIKSFIVKNFLFDDSNDSLANTDSFLERGIIDSTGVLELVLFLEETYGIKVQDEEISPNNMDSIANIAAYMQRKLARAGA